MAPTKGGRTTCGPRWAREAQRSRETGIRRSGSAGAPPSPPACASLVMAGAKGPKDRGGGCAHAHVDSEFCRAGERTRDEADENLAARGEDEYRRAGGEFRPAEAESCRDAARKELLLRQGRGA